MDGLYHQTNKIIQQTHESFRALENNPNNYQQIEDDIQEKIKQIER